MARLRALAVALLLAALVACEDEPQPDIADPTPSASTSTPSPTESSSTSSPTPEPLTPEETVRAWFAAWSRALVTGNATEVGALSDDSCASCGRLIEQLVSVYDRGGRYETDGWKPLTSVEAPDSTDSRPRFLLRIVEAKRTLFGPDGQQVDVEPRKEVPMRMTLVLDGESWLVSQLEILE